MASHVASGRSGFRLSTDRTATAGGYNGALLRYGSISPRFDAGHVLSPAPAIPFASTEDDLAVVVADLVARAGARGAILAVVGQAGADPAILFATPALSGTADLAALLCKVDGRAAAAFAPRWARATDDGSTPDVLIVPVARAPGPGRSSMVLMFDHLPEPRPDARALVDTDSLAFAYLRLWQRHRASARRVDALKSACDATDMGVMLLGRAGDLLYANYAATRLLEAGDGVRRQQASIQASEIGDGVKLQVALNHVIAGSTGSAASPRRAPLVKLRRGSRAPLIVAVVPVEVAPTELGDPAAIMSIFDPDADMERLLLPVCRLHGLSVMEARLASLLAGGNSVPETCVLLRIKEQTARSYLKSVFQKTGTNKQTELMHLLLTSMVRVGQTIVPEPF